MRYMTPEDLYNIAWVGEPEISPDGARVAFVVTRLDAPGDSYRSTIYVVETSGGEPRPFTAGTKRDT